MSLKYRDTHGSYFIRMGYLFHPAPNDMPNYIMSDYDPFYAIIRTSVLDLGYLPVEDVISVFHSQGPDVETIVRGAKPRPSRYDASVDRQRYGSILDSLAAGVRLLNGNKPFSVFDPVNQHQVTHAQYDGVITPRFVDDPLFVPDEQTIAQSLLWQFYTRGYNTINFVAGVTGTADLSGTVFDTLVLPTLPVAHNMDLLTVLKWLVESGGYNSGVVSNGYGTYLGEVANPHLSYDASTIVFDYISSWTSFAPANYSTTWRVTVTWRWRSTFIAPTSPIVMGDLYGWDGLNPTSSVSMTVRREHISSVGVDTLAGWGYPDGTILTSSLESGGPYGNFLGLSRVVRDVGISVPKLTQFVSYGPLNRFHSLVFDEAASIRNSSFQSSADCLDSLTGYVDNNVLQTLQKVTQLGALMPEFQDALRAILKLKNGDLVGSFASLVDFVTSLRLTASFVWRPQVEFVHETLQLMIKVIEVAIAASPGSHDLIARGVFRYSFPVGEFSREESTLITRTRLVVRYDPTSTLARILDVRALGILPTPSSIWDLIPFTFVVGWVTGLSQRMRAVENLSLLSLMGPRCFTHSYLVESLLTDKELERFGLARDASLEVDPPRLKVFVREVSAHIPAPHDGKYDFPFPSHPPDLSVVGSLFWQVF